MPLFRRSRSGDVAEVVKAVIAELEKANMLPVAQAAGVKTSSFADIVSQVVADNRRTALTGYFEELPWSDPNVSFGPGTRIPPASIDPVNDVGRTFPRTFEGPISWNLQLGPNREVPWTILRDAANVDWARRCIEIRKADVVALEWDITLTDQAIKDAMKKGAGQGKKGPSKARAITEVREKFEDQITAQKTFWETPDRMNGLDWPEWTNSFLEEVLVTDALSVYPHPALGRCPVDGITIPTHSIRLIDGATIKPLYDHLYNLPGAGQAAYQQILYGFPRGEYTFDPNARGAFLADQLIYKPRNRRVRSPYGLSATEQALTVIGMWVQREEWIRAEYGVGANPNTWLRPTSGDTGSEEHWTPGQRRIYEQALNDDLSGQTAARNLLKVLPPDLEPVQMQEFAEKYKPDYDERLILSIASFFDVMGTQINITPRGGLGGKGHQEGESAKAEAQARRPTVEYMTGVLNTVARKFLGMPAELTFTFRSTDEDDIGEITQSRQTEMFSGQRTLNELRAEAGEPLLEFDEADMPFVMTPGGGITFLEGASTKPTVMPGFPPAPGGPPVDPNAPKPPDPTKPPPKPGDDPNAVKTELDKFVTFATTRAKQGKTWRNFTFKVVDPDTAADLNELGMSGDMVTLKSVCADLPKADPAGGRGTA
jgi:hypothetical protein